MKLAVCVVKDSKTGLYDNPFYVRHIGEAVRQWDIVRQDKETKFGKNPEDFNLFQIANYDDELAKFEELSPAIHLASGV